jgi:hypothetical protein
VQQELQKPAAERSHKIKNGKVVNTYQSLTAETKQAEIKLFQEMFVQKVSMVKSARELVNRTQLD